MKKTLVSMLLFLVFVLGLASQTFFPEIHAQKHDFSSSQELLVQEDLAPDFFQAVDFNEKALQSAQGQILREYQGPLQQSPEVLAFRAQLPKLMENSIQKQATFLGLGAERREQLQKRIFVVICDRPQADYLTHMDTNTLSLNNKNYALIRVFAPALISKKMLFQETFEHEINHALARLMLEESYHLVPRWFREGLALLGAQQGQKRLRLLLAIKLSNAKNLSQAALCVEELCDGMDDDFDFYDYAESFLWLQFLEEQKTGGIQKVLEGLQLGYEFQEALERASELKWQDFQNAAHAYASRLCYDEEKGAFLKFMPIFFALNKKKSEGQPDESSKEQEQISSQLSYEEAFTCLESFYTELTTTQIMGKEPQLYLYPLVVFSYAQALAQKEDQASKQHAFEILEKELLPEGSLYGTSFVAAALKLYAERAQACGNNDAARRALQRLIYGVENPRYTPWAKEQLLALK